MSIYLDESGSAQLSDFESMIQRFIALFDDDEGTPVLVADEDELVDILNDAAVLLETDYSEGE